MTSSPQIKAMCFDFDGVLVDSTRLKTEAYVHFYTDRDPALVELIRNYCDYNSGLSRQIKFSHIQNVILQEPLTNDQHEKLCAGFRDIVLDQVLQEPLIQGTRESLEACQGQYTCFVASGTPHEEINQICEQRDLRRYFAGIGGSPTTKAAWLQKILVKLNLAPEQVVMIGDAPLDLEAARTTGVQFIGIGRRPESRLPEDEKLLSDLTGLLDRVATLYPRIFPR